MSETEQVPKEVEQISKTQEDSKEVFSAYSKSFEIYLENLQKFLPKYYRSFSDLQHEYLQDSEKITKRTTSFYNDLMRASETWNESAKNFAELNKNILDSWLSVFTIKKDETDSINSQH